jgi:cbb3-type cytochrome oxidase subunit 3
MANIFLNFLAVCSLAYGAGAKENGMFALGIFMGVFFAIMAYHHRPIPRNRYRHRRWYNILKNDSVKVWNLIKN